MTYNPLIGNADLRDSTGLSVIGRSANTTGDPADIIAGTDGYVLQRSGSTLIFGPAPAAPGGSGDVVGPGSATDNAITRFDGYTGKLLQNSSVLITDAGEIGAGNGTAALPAYSFTSDPNTGIWNAAADSLAITTGGTTRWTTSTTTHTSTLPILTAAGSETAPTYSFTDNPTTGFYCGAPGGGVLAIASSAKYIGNISAVGGSGQMVLYGSTPTGSGLFGVGLGDYDRRGYFAAEQGAIKIQSEYDGYDVVLQSTAAGSVKLKTGTSTRLTVSASAITTTVPSLGPSGDATAPSFSFSSDSNTGIYSAGSDQIAISAGGGERVYISTSVMTTNVPIQVVAGAAAGPSYSFTGDTDTGVYSAAANTIGISCGGISRTSQAGTLTTTDETATTIITISTATDKAYSVALQTVMRKTSNGDVNSYFTNIRIRNIAGTVSGTVLADSHGTDLGLTAITLAISGTNALVQVTGVAATTCEWKAFADVISV